MFRLERCPPYYQDYVIIIMHWLEQSVVLQGADIKGFFLTLLYPRTLQLTLDAETAILFA